jgi:FAD/FMN-containing dehydrogenase
VTTTQHSRFPLAQLRADLAGDVLGPEDAGYDDSRRVFLPSVERHPAAVVLPVDAEDVAHVVSLAAENGIELAVRGGGHSNAGHGTTDGGILLDLADLGALKIDADARVAHAAGGLTSGAVTEAAAPQGLAVGFGDTPSVGIGGLTLGGGAGYLVRKHGLTIDHLLAAEVVTADGEVLEVDERTHADLFWALRGGGGNFGVATRLRFRLHRIDQVVGGMLVLPASAEVIAGLVDAAAAAPEELSVIANVGKAEPHGTPVVQASMVFAGDPEAAARALEPIRALAPPLADRVRPIRYHELYDAPGHPRPGFDAGTNLLVDSVAPDAILEHLETATARVAYVQLRVLGGAMARVPGDATAFAHRGAKLMVNLAAMSATPETADEDWVRGLATALADGGSAAYAGFLGDEGDEGLRRAYPPATLARLADVKRRYDPDNVFRRNLNVAPAPPTQGPRASS